MVLCAGPTGSGKTTTLYATLTEIADPTRNVMTIEDPVEYIFPSINQIQTNEQAGLTFATGLRSILRQDPDVILVGEIRERGDCSNRRSVRVLPVTWCSRPCTQLGHRVRATQIPRYGHRVVLSGVLDHRDRGATSVRRICPSCTESYTLTDAERAFYDESGGPEKTEFVRGGGLTSAVALVTRSESASTSS